MKELSGSDALNIMFKELNIDSCTNADIYDWSRDYNERYPGVYLDYTRDVMQSLPSYMYYFDYKNNTYYKQFTLHCPICEDKHYKYPINKKYPKLEKYYKLKKIHEKSKNGKV